jgi:hypothetical protein
MGGLFFADQAAMEAAFASPEGGQTAQDYGQPGHYDRAGPVSELLEPRPARSF